MSEMCKICDETRFSLKGKAWIYPNQEITFTFSELLPAASPVFTQCVKKRTKKKMEKDTKRKSTFTLLHPEKKIHLL